jgi:DHA2 family multidrug resistance protein
MQRLQELWGRPDLLSTAHPLWPWIVLTNVLAMTFASLFSAAATLIADTAIQGDLALSAPEAGWVTILYMFGVNTTVPLASWLGVRYGTKKLYFLGVAIFTLGTLGVSLATHFFTLGFSRLIEGIGAGIIFPIGLSLIPQVFPSDRLRLPLALYVTVGFGGGLGIGTLAAGFITQWGSWRDSFIYLLPIGVAAMMGCALLHIESKQEKEKLFNIPGFCCLVVTIGSLLIALNLGALPSTNGGWRSPFILSQFALAACGGIGLCFFEKRHSSPLFPPLLFRDPVFSSSCFALLIVGMSLFLTISASTSYMLTALNYDKTSTGLITLTYGVCVALASLASSPLMRRVPIPLLSLMGLSCLAASYFLHQRILYQTGWRELLPLLILRGIGVGISLAPLTAQGLSRAPELLKTGAAALLTFTRQLGATYGGTLMTIVVIKRSIFHTARFSESVNRQIPGFQETYAKLYDALSSDLSTDQIEASKRATAAVIDNIQMQAFVTSLNDTAWILGWTTCAAILILGAATAFTLRRESLNKTQRG